MDQVKRPFSHRSFGGVPWAKKDLPQSERTTRSRVVNKAFRARGEVVRGRFSEAMKRRCLPAIYIVLHRHSFLESLPAVWYYSPHTLKGPKSEIDFLP